MTRPLPASAALVPVAILMGLAAADQDAQKGRGKGTEVTPETYALTFDLKQTELPQVEIFYAYYPGKTGAGKQELTLKADGLKLLRTRSMYTAAETREGPLPPQAVPRLLDVLAEENFFGLEERYPAGDHPSYRRVLRVTLPGRTKTVIVEGPAPAEFERIIGALKLAASMALPETLLKRFFPNL